MPPTIESWLNDTSLPRIWLGAISAMYSGDSIDAMPTPTPHRMRYRMNGVSAFGPMAPIVPRPISG